MIAIDIWVNLFDNLEELNKNLHDNELIKKFYNTYQLSDNNIEKFKLLLRKGIYLYEYMCSWKKFKGPVLLTKECYYSKLNDEHVSDSENISDSICWCK